MLRCQVQKNLFRIFNPVAFRVRTLRSGQPYAIQRASLAFARGFATPVNDQRNDSGDANGSQDNIEKDASHGPWTSLKGLEDTANMPTLFNSPPDDILKLRKSFFLVFQIVLSLVRSNDNDKQRHFEALFARAVVPPGSEIARGRHSVATLIKAIVHDISSIPEDSPLKQEHDDLFRNFGKLRALHDIYLKDGDISASQDWCQFWDGAKPVVIALLELLVAKRFFPPEMGKQKKDSEE